MADWDGERVSYSAQGLMSEIPTGAGAARAEERATTKRKMREFIRNFRLGPIYPYRDQVIQRDGRCASLDLTH